MQMTWEGRNSAGHQIVHVGKRQDSSCCIRNQAAFLFGKRSRCGMGVTAAEPCFL